MIWGRYVITRTNMNVNAAKVTAPAETSFIKPILGWFSLCTKSDNFSTAVFIPSIPKTKPIANVWLIQSCLEIPTIKPAKIVNEKMLGARFIKINEHEYENNIAAGQYFKEFYDKLIVTMSGKGCKYMDKEFNVAEVEVRDNSGAGDSFISALTIEYCRSKDIDKAIYNFEKTIKYTPLDIEFNNKLASTYIENKQFEKAKQILENNIKNNPKNWE